MLKSLNRLWWRSVKSISKKQQSQAIKLARSLLKQAVAQTRIPNAKPIRKKRVKQVAALPPRPAIRSAVLPGKWQAFYYSSFIDSKGMSANRMLYWLYRPANITQLSSLPLVVMLHGCEQSATQFSEGTRMNQLAEQKGFAVLYPQQSLKAHPRRCWPWYEKTTQDGGGEVQVIAAIIQKVVRQFALDRTRIYAAGISAGASMAHILALNHPHLIAAVGLHSGPVFGVGHTPMGAWSVMQGGADINVVDGAISRVLEKNPVFPKMPAILIQGQEDRVVRPVNQTLLAEQFKILNRLSAANALPSVLKAARSANSRNPANAYRTSDYISGRALLLRVCEIAQLEHAWSGGNCELEFNNCTGPDATAMMWEFFDRHQRPGIALYE